MIKYFVKEYTSTKANECYGFGCIDTEKTYNEEGVDYLVKMTSVETSSHIFEINYWEDIIDKDELDDLKYIDKELYEKIEKFCSGMADKYDDLLKEALKKVYKI